MLKAMPSSLESRPQGNPIPQFSATDRTRLGDAERNNTVSILNKALSLGQLDLPEFDKRCATVWSATVRADLAGLLDDLDFTNRGAERIYTESEIERAHQAGYHARRGVFWGGTLSSLAAGFSLITVTDGQSLWIPLFLIPALLIMLYVAHLGPDRWYIPSPQELDRQRIRQRKQELRMRSLERREERRETTQEWGELFHKSAQNIVRKTQQTWHDGRHE